MCWFASRDIGVGAQYEAPPDVPAPSARYKRAAEPATTLVVSIRACDE